jgi:hypothetical protein
MKAQRMQMERVNPRLALVARAAGGERVQDGVVVVAVAVAVSG